jgi:hypothetical protein
VGFSDGNNGSIADKNIFLTSTHKAAAYGYDTGPKTVFGVTTITTGVWHYIVGVFNGTNVTIYIDGSSDGSTACGNTFVGYAHPDLLLGGIDAGGSGDIGSSTYLDGIIDEPRFSSVARSAAWIAAEYNNQNSPGTFITMGSESCPSATPTPTPTPTATPTPTPTSTPTPTATPIPQCTVPNFIGARSNEAQSIWSNAGFTTEVNTVGPMGHQITSQSLPAGYIGFCSTTTITVTAQ